MARQQPIGEAKGEFQKQFIVQCQGLQLHSEVSTSKTVALGYWIDVSTPLSHTLLSSDNFSSCKPVETPPSVWAGREREKKRRNGVKRIKSANVNRSKYVYTYIRKICIRKKKHDLSIFNKKHKGDMLVLENYHSQDGNKQSMTGGAKQVSGKFGT